jgi:hypothetical protein
VEDPDEDYAFSRWLLHLGSLLLGVYRDHSEAVWVCSSRNVSTKRAFGQRRRGCNKESNGLIVDLLLRCYMR